MSDEFPFPRPRTIRRLGARTPLVVPSFSSRGFPAVDDIVLAARAHLYGSCLVSAYDLASGIITADLSGLGDVVIIDSGGYETASYQPAVGEHYTLPANRPWTRTDHRAFLRMLPDSAPVVVVAFDQHSELEHQLESAAEDFTCAPGAARCLLIKPSEAGALLSFEVAFPPGVEAVDVIGVTENELGHSMADRCRALVRLRRALGEDLPIHVFGTITPLSMLAYAMCGADVFDGLNWLRYRYEGGSLSAMADLAVSTNECELRDDLVRVEAWRRNLRWLSRFQTWLRDVGEGGINAISSAPLGPGDIDACMTLARRCGATEDR